MGIGIVGVTASDKAGEPEPETAAAYILKGQKLFAAKKVEEAQEAYRRALELEASLGRREGSRGEKEVWMTSPDVLAMRDAA